MWFTAILPVVKHFGPIMFGLNVLVLKYLAKVFKMSKLKHTEINGSHYKDEF